MCIVKQACVTECNNTVASYLVSLYTLLMATLKSSKSKMKRSHDSQGNRLAFELARLIEARHLTVKELAEQVDLSYEQTRRLVNGAALPSREALERICKILGADLKEMTTLLFAEKSQRVYGTDVVSEMTGKDPELAPIEASWPHLDSEQRAILIDIAEGMASRNRENTSAFDAMFPRRDVVDAMFPPEVTVEGFREQTRSSQSPEKKVKR